MSSKKTLIAAVVLAALALLVFLVVQPAQQKKQQRELEGEKIVELSFEAVEGLTLQRGDETMELVKRGDDWFMTAPFEDPTDRWAVQAIVSAFRYARPTRTLTDLPPDALSRFGLEQPREKLTLITPDKTATVLVGDMHQIGNSVYVMVEGEKVVHLVADSTIGALKKTAEELRRKQLLAPLAGKQPIRRIEIDQVDRPSLLLIANKPEKTGDENEVDEVLPADMTWTLNAPAGPTIDAETMKTVLDKLANVNAGQFLDKIGDSTDLAAYGLNKPQLTVTAVYGEGEQAQTLSLKIGGVHLGAAFYAQASDRAYLISINVNEFKPFLLTAADLRDRRLAPDFVADKVAFLDLQSAGGSYRISRSGDGWAFVDEKPANKERIDNLLAQIGSWRAAELIDGPRAAKLLRRVRGPQVVTLALFDADANAIARLRFSAPLDPEKIAPTKPKVKSKAKGLPPAEVIERVVVQVDGGYAGAAYLVEPELREEIPTAPEELKGEEKPAATPEEQENQPSMVEGEPDND
ncbi:MAG TPA: DUF4340 domain-containing protein [bacterium]|nr:DUF4340 domain-containing protein [bacterium]